MHQRLCSRKQEACTSGRVSYISQVRKKTRTTVREQPSFIETARKAQIIEAATASIAELGFMNASLAQIAKRAGISKSVIGYYFPTRDDLVREAVDKFYMTGHLQMMAHIETGKTPTETLRLYIKHNLAYIDENRLATKAMSEIVANFRTSAGELVFQARDAEPMIAGTAALFGWGQETGEFRPFDTRVMAVTLRAAVDAFAAQLAAAPEMDVQRYVEELTELFLRAARKES